MKDAAPSSLRRSVAVPRQLAEDALRAAHEEADNFNRVVVLALREFVARRNRRAFAREMDEMGRDPQILEVSQELESAFRVTDLDGLEA